MPEPFRQGRALLVGVANYPHVRPLTNSVLNDARALATLLQSPDYCGYPPENVELLLDEQATGPKLREALGRLAATVGPDGTAFLFFSGHGGRVATGPDAGTYLIPFDGRQKKLRETAIESKELTSLLAAIPAQRLVVVLDACHAGGTGELKELDPDAQIKAGFDEKSLRELASGVGRVILASSRSDELSWVLPGATNSLFTHHLLDALRGGAHSRGDGLIRVFDVFHYVSDKVPADKPIQHPIFKAHDLENNFALALFQGGKALPASAPTTTPGRPKQLSGPTRVMIARGLVTSWPELATYFEIPPSEQARFPRGDEPKAILDWLEPRGLLPSLRDAFTFLGWDHLTRELDRPR